MIAQQLEDAEYPIVFGGLTFDDRESRYSQPKLELYGVFRAIKAERFRLHNIHFRLIVDAAFITQMMTTPDLPNAVMTHWIAYIQLFTFEIQHKPGISHRVPDGLSRRRRADDDSEYSDDEVDIEEGIKLVKVIPRNFKSIKEEDEIENGLRVQEDLARTMLDRVPGEVKAIETYWSAPEALRYDHRYMYAGEGEELDIEEEMGKLDHPHRVKDIDNEAFWDDILKYLHLNRLPEGGVEASKVIRRAKRFFLMEGALWRRNGTKPPLLVILSQEVRERIARNAHDDSGHRGRDPTYRKLRDSYWWPNLYVYVASYCRTCHECQMRSTYCNTIPLQPQYVRTILRRFDIDSVHMPMGKGGKKYVVDLVDNLTGWVEARALRKLKASNVAEFLFEVMCRFGCVFQLTCDNGSEFKAATEELMNKYHVPIVRISPYNSQANGKIERTQRSYLEAIWKVLQGDTSQWPDWLGYALWADRITVKRNMGYSPYYLLYGQHPLLPFDVTDITFHALDWMKGTTTEKLLALRMEQLDQRNVSLRDAREKNYHSRQKAVEAYNLRHEARMNRGEYQRGELVLVYNDSLEHHFSRKGELRWRGPYAIVV